MTQAKAYVPDEPGESPLRSDLPAKVDDAFVDQAIREWCDCRNLGVDRHRLKPLGGWTDEGEDVPLQVWLHGEVDACLRRSCQGVADKWGVRAQRFHSIMERTLTDFYYHGKVMSPSEDMAPTRIEWFRGQLRYHLKKVVKLASGLKS